jgi:hypothetical protein
MRIGVFWGLNGKCASGRHRQRFRARLALAADGPISIDVQYVVRPVPGGSDVRASVSVEGQGLFGRVLARATEALLAAGALRASLERLARQLCPAAV